MTISFRPLAETDLADLHVWLNRPHLARYYQRRPISRTEVTAHYGPPVRGEEPTFCHLAFHDDAPLGYMQCYRIADWPEWGEIISEREGVGVDLAIVDPSKLRRGLGRAMLAGYLRDVAFPLFPGESKCFIGHDLENHVATACSKSVGFAFVRNFIEDGQPSALFVLERDKSAPGPF